MKKSRLSDKINHRIVVSATLLKRQIHRIISEEKLEITPDQWTILSYLWDENGLTVGELASRSLKDFANVTRIVDKLQKQAYVTKTKNEKDSRSFLVFYTDKAMDIKEHVERCQKRSTAISMEGLSETEKEIFLQIIKKIEANSLAFLNLK